jgi:hypothetical protein
MLKVLPKTVSAIAAAALVAGAITILPGASDQVSASAPLNSGKGDRLDIRAIGPQCSQQVWPYYEARCLKDSRQPMGHAKAVRIVSPDRVVLR